MSQFIYETMYILRPDLTDEQVQLEITKYQDLLKEQGGENIEVQNLGKRRLAYEINKHREGYYVQMNYEGPGEQIVVMEKAMRYSDEVVRYLTIKQKPAVVESPMPEVEVQAIS